MAHKILMVAPTSFFADTGCHMRILEEIYLLQSAGHHVTVCTYHIGDNVQNVNIKRSLDVPWKKGVQVGSSRHKLYFDVMLGIQALKTAIATKPDIIHAHLHEGALIGWFVKWLRGGKVPVVFDYQGSLTSEMIDHRFLKPGGWAHKPLVKLETLINQMADTVITSSQNAAGVLHNDFHFPTEKTTLIGDRASIRFHPYTTPKEQAQVSDLRRSLGIPEGRQVVVYLGVLAPYQGIDVLLQAARLLKERAPHLYFVVMGYPGVDSYRALAHELGLDDYVLFPGRIPYQDAPHYLALGDLAVAPKMSATEGVGKIVNYMAMGLPTVTFDTPNCRELLGDLGIYAQYGDPTSLAERIEYSLAPENDQWRLNLARQVRAKAVQDMTWEQQQALQQLEAVYAKVLKQPQPVRPLVTPAADSALPAETALPGHEIRLPHSAPKS